MSAIFEYGAIPLDCVGKVASWRRPVDRSNLRYPPMVIVMESSGSDDGVFTPAASVTIYSKEQLIALRAAIDEALKEEA